MKILNFRHNKRTTNNISIKHGFLIYTVHSEKKTIEFSSTAEVYITLNGYCSHQ